MSNRSTHQYLSLSINSIRWKILLDDSASWCFILCWKTIECNEFNLLSIHFISIVILLL